MPQGGGARALALDKQQCAGSLVCPAPHDPGSTKAIGEASRTSTCFCFPEAKEVSARQRSEHRTKGHPIYSTASLKAQSMTPVAV